MDNNKYELQDLVMSALEQKPDEFAQGFNDLLVGRLNTAIEAKKQEVAYSMFADPDQYNDSDESENADYEETDLNPEE